MLSEEEEAVVSQRVIQRYPQADQDGDGVLSETEKQDLIQKASQREKNNGRVQQVAQERITKVQMHFSNSSASKVN